MRELRIATAILTGLIVAILVGGAFLWSDVEDATERNTDTAEAVERQSAAHCEALDDIHKSLVAFVREHHQITIDLREVGVFHEQVPLRETLKPLRVECARREFSAPPHGAPGHDHPEDHQRKPSNGRSEGGDAAGPAPGGGGGPPGGQEPPAEQGVLDPIIDPTPPAEECHVNIAGITVCTEPDQ